MRLHLPTTKSGGMCQRAAVQQEPALRGVRGILLDGFDSTTRGMRTRFPGARLAAPACVTRCNKLPKKLAAIPSPDA